MIYLYYLLLIIVTLFIAIHDGLSDRGRDLNTTDNSVSWKWWHYFAWAHKIPVQIYFVVRIQIEVYEYSKIVYREDLLFTVLSMLIHFAICSIILAMHDMFNHIGRNNRRKFFGDDSKPSWYTKLIKLWTWIYK